MDAREFEAIKSKAVTLKEKYTKAQGALETLRENNVKEFGTNDLDALRAMIESNNGVITQTEGKINSMYTELKGLTNWNLL